jgi:hypothetical protein
MELSLSDMRLAWAGCARSATAETDTPAASSERKLSNASSVFPNGCGTDPESTRFIARDEGPGPTCCFKGKFNNLFRSLGPILTHCATQQSQRVART